MFAGSYASLVRLAALITGSTPEAEEIVQDAFLGLHRNWAKAQDPHAYVRRAVVNGSRSALRRKSVARRHAPTLAAAHRPHEDRHDEAWDLIAGLPARQRTALILHYWMDLTVPATAEAMGCRQSTVRTLLHRALTTLRKEVQR